MAFELKLLKRALIYIFNQFFNFTSYRDINDYFIINFKFNNNKKIYQKNNKFAIFIIFIIIPFLELS